MGNSDFVSAADAARVLGCDRRSIPGMFTRAGLPVSFVARRWIVRRADLEALVSQREQPHRMAAAATA